MPASTPVQNEGTLDLGRSLQHRQRKGLNPSVQKDAAQQDDKGMSVTNEDEDSSGTSSDDTSSDSSSEDGDSDEEDEEQVIEMNLDLGVLEEVKNTSSNLDMTNGTSRPPVASASTTTSKRQPITKDGDVINFQPQNKKPKFVLTPDPNSVANRLPGFLEQLKAANAELEKKNAADYRMEIVDATAEEDRKLTPVGIEEL